MEATGEITFVHREMLRQFLAVDRLGEVFVEIGHDRTSEALSFGAQALAPPKRLLDLPEYFLRAESTCFTSPSVTTILVPP
jgi:hypothetical protein